MSSSSRPTTTKAWQYTTLHGQPLEKNLTLNPSVPVPPLGKNDSLIRVHAAALNPVDYKIPQIFWPLSHFLPSPATPGVDFAGELVETNDKTLESFVGKMVMGSAFPPPKLGACSEYMVIKGEGMIQPVPQNIDIASAASATLAINTAYQSLIRFVDTDRYNPSLAGRRILINGASGGVGVFGVQIAKALGAEKVTATCSTGNVSLVKELGADQIIDYKQNDMCAVLKDEVEGKMTEAGYDLVVDNVGEPDELYKASDAFLKDDGVFVQVAGGPSLKGLRQ
ncbi:MAG: hypothetical protein Q9162_000954 [Coniocarpon cinnabarinum]